MSDGILTRSAGRIASTLDRAARTVEGVAVSGFAPAIRDPRRGEGDPAGNGLPWVEEIDPAGADLAAFRTVSDEMRRHLRQIVVARLYPSFQEFPQLYIGEDQANQLVGLATTCVWTTMT